MLFVGDYVKFKNGQKTHMGVIVKIDEKVVTVFVKYPYQYTMDTFGYLLEKVPFSVYSDYLDGIYNTGNYVIDHSTNNEKSIEQQIESYFDGDYSMCNNDSIWGQEVIAAKLDNKEEVYDDIVFLDKKEREDLNKLYIELALLTGDEEWFRQLVSEVK